MDIALFWAYMWLGDVFAWFWANADFNVHAFWVWPVLALAAWRWASLLVLEDGPFGVFMWLRVKRGVATIDMQGSRMVTGPAFTAFSCIKCMSVWTAFWLVWMPLPVLVVFAASAGAIWLHGRMP